MACLASGGIEIGLCGFGASGGLIPELRLGVVRLWCCRGSAFGKLRDALSRACDELRRAP